jgi:hypothetical protein
MKKEIDIAEKGEQQKGKASKKSLLSFDFDAMNSVNHYFPLLS